jgi:hypothetical protein
MSDCTTNRTIVEIRNGTTMHAKPKGVMITRLHKSFGNSQNSNNRKKKRSSTIAAMSERRTVVRTAETTFSSISWSSRSGPLRIPESALGTMDETLKGRPWQSGLVLLSHPKQILSSPIVMFLGTIVSNPDCTAAAASVATAWKPELTALSAAWTADVASPTAVAMMGGTSTDVASGILGILNSA